VRSWPILLLAIIGGLYALGAARAFLLPVLVAILAKMTLAPVVHQLTRRRVPAPLAAFLVIATLLGGVGYGAYVLAAPTIRWIDEIPEIARDLKDRIGSLRGSVARVAEAQKRVEELAGVEDDSPGPPPVEVTVRAPARSVLSSGVSDIVINLFAAIVLVFFMLVSDDNFLRKIVSILPLWDDKKLAVTTIREIESQVARYLATIFFINTCLGLVVAAIAYANGLPNPLFWGVLAGLLNFIPYIGGLIGAALLGMVAIHTLGPTVQGFLVPGAYILANALEGTVLTPMILGRRFSLSPTVIFIWLMVMSWLWGPVGVMIATPLLVAIRISCENIPRFRPLATMMGS
jgi:predicted PurR-regulated permease PerM